MKNYLKALLVFMFSIQAVYSQCIVSSPGSNTSVARASWGQSFRASCTSQVKSISFNSASNVPYNSQLVIKKGSNCSASVIQTQTIHSIVDGVNTVVLATPLSIVQNETYYFSVTVSNGTQWMIRFNQNNAVAGNLMTYTDGSSIDNCNWNFPGFDWNFSVNIPENIDLFIWAGQSNAQGWAGNANYYPADLNNLDSQIRLNYEFINNTSSAGWTRMGAQAGRFPNGHFGPEVSFAREMKQLGYNPAIFKYTEGSTSIYNHWKVPGGGGYYDLMKTKLKIAIDQLKNMGHTVTIRGFVWIQGESDSDTQAHANAYKTSFLNMISDIRNNVAHNPVLPVVTGVDEQHPSVINIPTVLNAHKEIASNDHFITFTSMIGLPKADVTHLTPAGLVTHGRIIYDAMTCLLGHACPPGSGLKQNETVSENAGNVTIYPNPAKDIVNIKNISKADLNKLNIYNVIGQNITKQISWYESNSGIFTSKVSKLRPGLYFVYISSGLAGKFYKE